MRENLPVMDQEFDYPADELLMSTTDSQGRITHCNAAFERVSGYTMQELMGQPHNLVRHPDMPPEAFKDMWSTIGHGRSWKGLVKNRRKDCSFYWVAAHVTPIVHQGRPVGYMSVRAKPTRAQVQSAEALYAQLHAQRGGSHSLRWRCTPATCAARAGATTWASCSACPSRSAWPGCWRRCWRWP